MGKQNFIEINGKKYDTVSGKLISKSPVNNTPVIVVRHANNSGIVDGFSRRTTTQRQVQTVNHASKQPQKSKTLMRGVVAKPAPKLSSQQHNTIKQNAPSLNKHISIPAHRIVKAQAVSKSPLVHKFNHSEAPRTSVVKSQAALPVQPTPKQVHTMSSPSQSSSIHSRQVDQSVIEHALKNAKSHEQVHSHTNKKSKRNKLAKKLGISRRLASLSSGALAVVLLAGFFAIQNVPNLSMKVAATRAGFNATMPSYKPSGFSFKGPINYSSGQVTVSFRSNIDERSYEFVQKSSNWNSDALVANFLEPEGKQFQTYLEKGRTLYIYDNSNATWVDDGVWYKIEGNSSMTSEQLIRIVNSV